MLYLRSRKLAGWKLGLQTAERGGKRRKAARQAADSVTKHALDGSVKNGSEKKGSFLKMKGSSANKLRIGGNPKPKPENGSPPCRPAILKGKRVGQMAWYESVMGKKQSRTDVTARKAVSCQRLSRLHHHYAGKDANAILLP